jgi:ubiquinone biosynthesis protein COQ9
MSAPPPYVGGMDDTEFDRAVIGAAFAQVAERGWLRLSIAAAAREAGLPLDRARLRFPGRFALLIRFGRLADATALASVGAVAGADDAATSPRDRLFDLLMRRLDVLQAHRAGLLALMRALPADPAASLLLARASLRSMRWMLEGAGISAAGPRGQLRAKGLLAAWMWTIRAWSRDETDDLAPTMAALDTALARAERADAWLRGPRRRAEPSDAEPAGAAESGEAPKAPDAPSPGTSQ